MIRNLVLIFLMTGMCSCGKVPDPNAECPNGYIHFTNNSNTAYKIYVDGNLVITLEGKKDNTQTVVKGPRSVKIQEDGSATSKTTVLEVAGCATTQYAFP